MYISGYEFIKMLGFPFLKVCCEIISQYIILHVAQVTSVMKFLERYCEVASSSMSRLVAHPMISRLLMKQKFDAYVL